MPEPVLSEAIFGRGHGQKQPVSLLRDGCTSALFSVLIACFNGALSSDAEKRVEARVSTVHLSSIVCVGLMICRFSQVRVSYHFPERAQHRRVLLSFCKGMCDIKSNRSCRMSCHVKKRCVGVELVLAADHLEASILHINFGVNI